MVLVDLVGWALLERCQDVGNLRRGIILGGTRWGEIGKTQQALSREEPDHLPELEGVTGHARVVPEPALAGSGAVQGQKVRLHRGKAVHNTLPAVLKFS